MGVKEGKVKINNIKNGDSSIKIGNENQIENAVIGRDINNINIIKNVTDNSVNYEVNKEDLAFLTTISPYLIRRFGVKKIGYTGVISLIFSVIGLLTGFNSSTPNVIYPYIPAFPNSYANSILIISFFFLALGMILRTVIKYHTSSQCNKCNKDFAYEEVRTPTVKEVTTSEGIRKVTTRTYECKFCGDVDVKTEREYIENSPSSI